MQKEKLEAEALIQEFKNAKEGTQNQVSGWLKVVVLVVSLVVSMVICGKSKICFYISVKSNTTNKLVHISEGFSIGVCVWQKFNFRLVIVL